MRARRSHSRPGGRRSPLLVTAFALCLVAPAGVYAGPPARPAASATTAPGARATDDPKPSPHLFHDLLGDFRQFLLSPDNALWLAAGGGAALAAHQADVRTTTAFGGDTNLHDAFAPGGVLGNGFTEIGAAAGLFGLGLAFHHDRTVEVGSALLRANLVAGAVTDVIKVAAGRRRPDGGHLSFPSGHTSVTFASAMVLEREYGWKVGVPALAVASYVGASRVQGLHHYLSDVVFGAAIGLTAGRTVMIRARRLRLTMSPAVVPGGVAVVFGSEPR